MTRRATTWDRPEQDPYISISTAMTTHPRDWGADPRDAWIYGVVVGWDDESIEELAEKHRWKPDDVFRLGLLRGRFLNAFRRYTDASL